MSDEQINVFGVIDGAGLYGEASDLPGFTVNGKLYVSTRSLSSFAAGILGKPAVVQTFGGWATALHRVDVDEREGVSDVPPPITLVRAIDAKGQALLLDRNVRLSVRITQSATEGRVNLHVWNDATNEQMPDDSAETYGVLAWLNKSINQIVSERLDAERDAMRSEPW